MIREDEKIGLVRLIAAYDRRIAHPEIYEDLKDE